MLVRSKEKNTGIAYEHAAKAIFDCIVNERSEHVRSIEVLHNTTLTGKTLTHQIDVYWKFEIGGVVYQTVVQTKDWDSAIKQSHLLEFKGVLDDIPGQPRGVYVTRKGYQKGAQRFATVNGIELFVLRPKLPTAIQLPALGFATMEVKRVPVSDSAPVGRIIDATVFVPKFTNLRLNTAVTSVADGHLMNGWAKPAVSESFNAVLRDVVLFNEIGEPSGTLEDVIRPFLESARENPSRQAAIAHGFDDNTFIFRPGSAQKEKNSVGHG